MINTLDAEQIALLKKRHKTEKSGDARDRIKTVALRNSGWTEERIAEALLIHIDTVKRHLKDYHDSEQKKLKSENGGSVRACAKITSLIRCFYRRLYSVIPFTVKLIFFYINCIKIVL